MIIHVRDLCVFHSEMCNKASSRGFDAAAEEVWVWLPLHDIRQNQPHCGCTPHPTDTRGTVDFICLSWHILFSFLITMSVMFSFGDQNQAYELYAVVEHFGDLRSGHYTATIKSQEDNRWYNFNDATVTLVRLIALTSVLYILQCKQLMHHVIWFGCSFHQQLDNQPFQQDAFKK